MLILNYTKPWSFPQTSGGSQENKWLAFGRFCCKMILERHLIEYEEKNQNNKGHPNQNEFI